MALRLLLEQEPEVLAIGLGLIVLGDDPEVELLCISMQRGERLVRCHRVIAAGGGVDLLFRGGIGSIPGEVIVAVALQLLLGQEPEVLALGLGLVVLRDNPEVELFCIPMRRSERLV